MVKLTLILSLLFGCDTLPVSSTSQSLGPNAWGCYDPVDYGAVPNDGVDDRPAMQAAVDAACAAAPAKVCIGAGQWDLTRAPPGNYNRFAALSLHCANVEIVGAGPATVLSVGGDQGNGTTYTLSLDPGSRSIAIRDLTIDTSDMFNTDEQSHAIAIGSGVCAAANGTCSMPVLDIAIERVRFLHPSTSGSRKGDCIRLIGGSTATYVRGVSIRNVDFEKCARSSVAIQRGVYSLDISNNWFRPNPVDQHIDGEPTGCTGICDDGITIADNIFDDDVVASQGDYAVAIGHCARTVITGNVFNGRGVLLYRCTGSTIADNTFNATMRSGYGVIELENANTNVAIHHNAIARGGFAGPLIRVGPHSGGAPSGLVIDHNTGTQSTAAAAIVLDSGRDVSIDHNVLSWSVPATTAQGVFVAATSVVADGIVIDHNTIVGQLNAGVYLTAAPSAFEAAVLTGNYVRGATFGLRCNQSVPGLFRAPLVSVGNVWGATSCVQASLGPGQ